MCPRNIMTVLIIASKDIDKKKLGGLCEVLWLGYNVVNSIYSAEDFSDNSKLKTVINSYKADAIVGVGLERSAVENLRKKTKIKVISIDTLDDFDSLGKNAFSISAKLKEVEDMFLEGESNQYDLFSAGKNSF